MCGRYAIKTSVPELARALGDPETRLDGFEPSYNVAPTQRAPVLRETPDGVRRLDLLRWGLVPSWARDAKIGNRTINARAETVASKPSFRAAYRSRRCVVPASGYYEWRPVGGVKQPYFIHPPDEGVLRFAGLWESWTAPDGGALLTFTILTTEAQGRCAEIHHRMPVMLGPAQVAGWLGGAAPPAPGAAAGPEGSVVIHPVSTRVNSPRHDDPTCIQPIADG